MAEKSDREIKRWGKEGEREEREREHWALEYRLMGGGGGGGGREGGLTLEKEEGFQFQTS